MSMFIEKEGRGTTEEGHHGSGRPSRVAGGTIIERWRGGFPARQSQLVGESLTATLPKTRTSLWSCCPSVAARRRGFDVEEVLHHVVSRVVLWGEPQDLLDLRRLLGFLNTPFPRGDLLFVFLRQLPFEEEDLAASPHSKQHGRTSSDRLYLDSRPSFDRDGLRAILTFELVVVPTFRADLPESTDHLGLDGDIQDRVRAEDLFRLDSFCHDGGRISLEQMALKTRRALFLPISMELSGIDDLGRPWRYPHLGGTNISGEPRGSPEPS